ncbi:class I SAM-dependent methyltransferase [Phenylobacterium montanum]|uniref:Class I SAM-dependent methyltransferase n=1 Tax=Phenylobacterium montanum TaxID=2823693 RepID=A0A975G461_9CAUL|nr:class I SAM-dependent methyltransferase [Caulobacter sp. S6]QUD90469.1 class I SAM-dependent methyltransferase [Caulobacter sp. S6]
MADDAAANAAQAEYWNTGAGETWAEMQDILDRQIQPLGAPALKALAVKAGERVLDIGCGCGQSSLQLAEAVGPEGQVVGVDISRPMLEVARSRAMGPVEFREADAQTADLGHGSFDAVFSRFGVMFFEDPAAAFANIRKHLKSGGRMAFICWRAPQESPLMTAPMIAAAPFLPPQEPMDPLAPGPFAFADPERLRGILQGAGFTGVAIEPFEAKVGSGDLEQSVAVAFRIGPLGRAIREHPDKREVVTDAVRAAIAPYVTPEGVRMPAAIWVVTATVE